jgi:hypothetical protein
VYNVSIATPAEFSQLKPSRGILFVFGGGVVTFLAFCARQRNDFIFFLRTHFVNTPFISNQYDARWI